MQDNTHQAPVLRLVPVQGDGYSVSDLEREALTEVLRAAEDGLSSLSGSGSTRQQFLRSVQSGATSLLAVSSASQLLLG
jgi:hypothetical protein